MKKSLFCVFLAVSSLAAAEFHLDPAMKQLELLNGAKVSQEVLDLTKKRSAAIFRGTASLDLSRGGTLMAECRFHDLDRSPEKFRYLLSKHNAFLFGVTGGKYNFSLCTGGRWSLAVIGGELPANMAWIHLAAVAHRVEEKEQGRVGFQLEIYVNGEKILSRFTPCAALQTSLRDAVQLGTPSEDTRFSGYMANVQLFDRALSPAEILQKAKQSRFVKITTPGQFAVSPDIEKTIAALQKKTAGKTEKFALHSLRRAALTGVPADKVRRGIAAAEKLSATPDGEYAERFNAEQNEFRMLPAGQGMLFWVNGECGKAFPVIDLLDLHTEEGVFGDRANGFRIRFRDEAGKPGSCTDFSDDMQIFSHIQPADKAGDTPFEIRWELPGKLEAVSRGNWGKRGLRMTLEVNPQRGIALESVSFPQWSLARKKGNDLLVTPYMSGLLIPDPINRYSYERDYPCAQIAMLFQAYYSENGDGVYVALEDPTGVAHTVGVYGKGGQLRADWRTLVPKNSAFRLPGEAVARLFQGDWYTSAQLYREFAAEKAQWWIRDVPRSSTPQWLRNNSIWILAGVFPTRNVETMLYLRKYFDQEFGVHYIGTCERAWPHFDRTTKHAEKQVKKLQAAGLKVIPYLDPRLWRETVKNGAPADAAPEWEDGAADMAVLRADGKPVVEKYGKYSCLVLCPASPAWQKTYGEICADLAEQGFSGLYHDQLPCAHFEPCYNEKHRHKPGDPAAWIPGGYSPFYLGLRSSLRAKYPELFHTGEDASEPYLSLVDGFTTWRWVEPDQIPLFQTVYSGRIQFTGKLYNHQYPGDWESNFAKAGTQFVNAEQLGWITLEDLETATPLRKFFKTLAWYRRALLEYFNAGQRMAPLKFSRDPGTIHSVWGNTSGHGQTVASPKIMHAVYRLADGRIMAVFVNITPEVQHAAVRWPYGVKNLRICRPRSGVPVTAETVPELELPPYSGEVWLQSPADNRQEAEAIAALWHKTYAFDEGENLHWRRSVRQKAPAEIMLTPGVLQSVLSAAQIKQSARRYFANGTDKDKVLHLGNNGVLRYENIALPADTAIRRIAVVAAWLPEEEGGVFEIRSAGRIIGRATLGKGGRYLAFREVPVALSGSPAKGSDLEICFIGKSCRIKGFKVLPNP